MYESAIQNLIDELGRLPGVGPKSAQRLAFHILNTDAAEMEKLTTAIARVKNTVSFCEICGNVSETPTCAICRDDRRDVSAICVVEESKDVVAIERTRSFTGRYHVLGGSIDPLAGVGPDQLRIRELVARLSDERVQEIILAMDPNLEGEATATYLSRLLVPIGLRISRLASGLPVGGDLEYADEITLGRALEGRRVISEGNRSEEEDRVGAFEEAAEADASAREAVVEERKESAPKTGRWSGSMFDEIDEAPSDKAAASGATDAPVEGEQASLNEALLEAEIEKVSGEEAREIPGDGDPDSDIEQGHDVSEDTSEEAVADRERRRDAYEERLAELQKQPLRTATPDVPPIPGATYVNPWT